MAKHSIVHIEIPSGDAGMSAAFYRKIFGWKTEEHPLPTGNGETFVQYMPPSGPGGIFLALSDGVDNGRPVGVGDILLYVTTGDAEATLSRAEAFGGKVVIPAREGGGGVLWGMFTDPTGNRIGIIQRSDTPDKITEPADRAIVHIELSAANPAEAADFYKKLFGWKRDSLPLSSSPDGHYWQFIPEDEPSGGLIPLTNGRRTHLPVAPGDVLIYIATEDVELTLEKIEKQGGKTIVERRALPGLGWWAMFTDPTGNRIGLYEVKQRESITPLGDWR